MEIMDGSGDQPHAFRGTIGRREERSASHGEAKVATPDPPFCCTEGGRVVRAAAVVAAMAASDSSTPPALLAPCLPPLCAATCSLLLTASPRSPGLREAWELSRGLVLQIWWLR
ncbi:hypothetical protein E2C01_046992 [Portunus trituberculatus]|uniref:Uncharacterized protein n=1 Tax=Portunus trituberculatus TaxID=210409 RepID=A0A5B7G6C8_PORTR|nr:hypothetical protein [Portunus trituberculatus]